jgi:hypothetical protein
MGVYEVSQINSYAIVISP